MTHTNKPKKAHLTSTRSLRAAVDGAQIQKHRLVAGITSELGGAEHMNAVLACVPPGAPTKVHRHKQSETILFMVEGWGGTLVGPELDPVFHGPGDFVFVPKDTIHIGFNLSRTHRVVLTETRSNNDFNHDVILMPELEEKALKKIRDLQDQFAAGTLELPDDWQDVVGVPYDFKE